MQQIQQLLTVLYSPKRYFTSYFSKQNIDSLTVYNVFLAFLVSLQSYLLSLYMPPVLDPFVVIKNAISTLSGVAFFTVALWLSGIIMKRHLSFLNAAKISLTANLVALLYLLIVFPLDNLSMFFQESYIMIPFAILTLLFIFIAFIHFYVIVYHGVKHLHKKESKTTILITSSILPFSIILLTYTLLLMSLVIIFNIILA